jgi:MFS superfamily sulfate permease-like transporter
MRADGSSWGRHDPARRLPYGATSLNIGPGAMSSFGTYLIGFIILVVGLAFAAYLLNVPQTWIFVGVIVLIGIGVLSATTRTKMRDPNETTTTTTTRPPSAPNG